MTPPATILQLPPSHKSMTDAEWLAFITIRRRQLDRFFLLPHADRSELDAAGIHEAKRLLDEIEQDIFPEHD